MKIIPKLTPSRSTQLEYGELYVARHEQGASVGLIVLDPSDGDRCNICLGPTFPQDTVGPHLLPDSGQPVLRIGKEFVLRLPVKPDAWRFEPPSPDCHSIAVTDDDAYFRVNYASSPGALFWCFVSITAGRVFIGNGPYRSYPYPSGVKAFATEWTLLLPGDEEQIIYHYKWAEHAGGA